MTMHGNGPPERERAAPQDDPNRRLDSETRQSKTSRPWARERVGKPGTSLTWVPCTWSSPQDTHSQLERRRAAAHRSVPLGCRCRDPLSCTCYATEPPLSDHQLDSWRAAALKVLSVGELPLLPIEVRRELWKRGGPDRVLAQRLHEACGGETA